MKALIYIFIAVIFISCSPQKRLSRLEKFHPELFATEIRIDTVVIDSVHIDTLVKWNELKTVDTIILTKDNLTVKFIKLHDTIKLLGEIKQDTVYKEIVIKQTIPQECKSYWYWWLIGGAGAMLLIFILIKLL